MPTHLMAKALRGFRLDCRVDIVVDGWWLCPCKEVDG